MMNIPINFNIPSTNKLGNNLNTNQQIKGVGDFMGKEFSLNNSINSNSSTEKYENKLSGSKLNFESEDDVKNTLSDFEDVLNKLIEEDKDLKLNEDISFLQSIVALFSQNNNQEDTSINSMNTTDINLDLLSINKGFNNIDINTIKELKGNISLDKAWELLNNSNSTLDINLDKLRSVDLEKISTNKELDTNIMNTDFGADMKSDINLEVDSNINTEDKLEASVEVNSDLEIDSDMILEFTQQLDNDFIDNFKKLDTLEEKKDAILTEFKEFVSSYVDAKKGASAELNDFYSAFKTNFELENNFNKLKNKNFNLESMNSNDIIELLGSNVSNTAFAETLNASKANKLTDVVLYQETLIEDLQNTIIQMNNYNIRQLKIKLSPKELGEMTIDISQLNDISNIRLTMANKETLDLVKSNLGEIVEHLKESNLISDTSTVTIEADTSNKESFSSSFGNSSTNKERNSSAKNERNISENNDTSIDTNTIETKDTNLLNILA